MVRRMAAVTAFIEANSPAPREPPCSRAAAPREETTRSASGCAAGDQTRTERWRCVAGAGPRWSWPRRRSPTRA
eukprot:6854480-Pyramimonas_sp.AAC.1